MVNKPSKEILSYKKKVFLKGIVKASIFLGVSVPEVKFWEHYENHFDEGERAHIHVDRNLICIAEPELEKMSEEDISVTASHEVSHLHHLGHGWGFQKTQQDLEIGFFEPPPGNVGALPENYVPPKEKKEKPSKPIKYKCNSCEKKGKTKKCNYCGKYFCDQHIHPKEPIIGSPRLAIDRKDAHPCFLYSRYLIKKEEKEDKEYALALERLCKRKKPSDFIEEDSSKENLIKFKSKKKIKNVHSKNLKESSIGPKKERRTNPDEKRRFNKILDFFRKS